MTTRITAERVCWRIAAVVLSIMAALAATGCSEAESSKEDGKYQTTYQSVFGEVSLFTQQSEAEYGWHPLDTGNDSSDRSGSRYSRPSYETPGSR